MRITEFKVSDVKGGDDGSSISILCTETPALHFKGVTLIFDEKTPHKQVDELADLLLNRKLVGIQVQD